MTVMLGTDSGPAPVSALAKATLVCVIVAPGGFSLRSDNYRASRMQVNTRGEKNKHLSFRWTKNVWWNVKTVLSVFSAVESSSATPVVCRIALFFRAGLAASSLRSSAPPHRKWNLNLGPDETGRIEMSGIIKRPVTVQHIVTGKTGRIGINNTR